LPSKHASPPLAPLGSSEHAFDVYPPATATDAGGKEKRVSKVRKSLGEKCSLLVSKTPWVTLSARPLVVALVAAGSEAGAGRA